MKRLLFLFLCLPALALAQTLSWVPPTERQNGEPLSVEELSEYVICWGTEQDLEACNQSLKVFPPSTSIPVKNIVTEPGTYYFAIRAVDTEGLTSPLSKSATAKILAPPNAPTLSVD